MNKICTLPWMHLETTPLGEFRPCCLAEETIPDYNISRGDTINNAFNSVTIEIIILSTWGNRTKNQIFTI